MQATKSGPGHHRPSGQGHRRPRRTSGAKIALGTLTAVLVVLVLDAGCASSAPGVADGAGRVGTGTAVARSGLPGRHQAAPKAPLTSLTPTASPPAASPPAASPAPSAKPSVAASPRASPQNGSGQPAAAQVLAVINQARAQAGLPAYALSAGLDTSSRAHTVQMAGGCGLTHQCPGETALPERLTQAGVAWSSWGENVGEGGPEPDTAAAIAQMAADLTQEMLNEQPPDDGHRLNILSSSFRQIGISVLRDASGTVWMTQDFSS